MRPRPGPRRRLPLQGEARLEGLLLGRLEQGLLVGKVVRGLLVILLLLLALQALLLVRLLELRLRKRGLWVERVLQRWVFQGITFLRLVQGLL